jgi:hypothetical protein
MDRIRIDIHRICEDDPRNYPLGFLYFNAQKGSSSFTTSLAPAPSQIDEDGLDYVVKQYRKNLLEIESQLSKGIEEVRALLENLPATSIESAPTAPLFADEAVS